MSTFHGASSSWKWEVAVWWENNWLLVVMVAVVLGVLALVGAGAVESGKYCRDLLRQQRTHTDSLTVQLSRPCQAFVR